MHTTGLSLKEMISEQSAVLRKVLSREKVMPGQAQIPLVQIEWMDGADGTPRQG